MKCQKCEKLATFHITELFHVTELDGMKPQEHHLCEEHAREYLNESSEHSLPAGSLAATLAEGASKQVSVSKTAAELKELDQQTCPVCGISFYDFRSRGRLGCPNDYDCFSKQLDNLIANIHGHQEHTGKIPKRSGCKASNRQHLNQRTSLIRLRRELDDAVQCEAYERATTLRDQIKEIEQYDY
jgi:protein arginine kinase activator